MKWKVKGLSAGLVAMAACTVGGCADGPPPGDGTQRLQVQSELNATLHQGFDSEPVQWVFPDGQWQQREVGGNGVLAQTATDRDFPVALWKKHRFRDVDVSVRFKPISGRIDASGGIVFRARDARNYYVVRANSLENNLRLYTVIDGDRGQIAGTKIEAPKLAQWHTLRAVAVGSRIQAYLDGHLSIDHRDETFQAGYVGLWTKADAITEFDDLDVGGMAEE